MKILFLHFFDFSPFSGISKKINYQISAFRNLGHQTDICYIRIDSEGQQYRVCGDQTIDVFGTGPLAKIVKWFRFKNLTTFIKDTGYDLLYVRSFYNTTPSLLKMFRILHKAGIRIIVELPTYPYEREFDKIPFKNKFTFYLDKVFRNNLKKHVDFIVTFSDYDEIFGVKTIQISNGIDFDQVKIKKESNGIKKNIRLLGVAEIHYWHGFDRVIKGLAEYYGDVNNNRTDVFFDIVGEGVKEDLDYLKRLVMDNNLGDYVVFHGNCHGEQLDNLFDKADFGVASLARHRSGITKIKTLKTREYAARGIPFIYSEIDDDFDSMPYIIKASMDETPVDIGEIVGFCQTNRFTPLQIRNSVKDTLSWDVQMKKVIESVSS